MQLVDDIEATHPRSGLSPAPIEPRRGIFETLEQHRVAVIVVLALLAFLPRVYRLDAAGLSEDETNKVFALRAYAQGDFTVNAEHPMLMKMLCFASFRGAGLWNSIAPEGHPGFAISEESALRLPNVIFGALTVVPLFLLTSALLGFRVGLITSTFWATGLNAIWINRIAKEDTLLVFFMFCGFYLYNRAKTRPASDLEGQKRLYALAGAAFGLMMASKYFPHYLGLNALFYHLAGYNSRTNRPVPRSMTVKFFAAMLLAFVAFNPAIVAPQTWRYLSKYVTEDLLTHHGYLFMDRLVYNEMSQTPEGVPWYFYWLFLAIKVPLPLAAAFLLGIVDVVRRRREPEYLSTGSHGYLFIRMTLFIWAFPMALVGAKFLRYTLALMPLVYMTAAIGIVAAWEWLTSALEKNRIAAWPMRGQAAALFAAVFVVAPAVISARSLPYPSLFLNSLGGDRVGYYFPHDEFYDLGARESVRYIAEHAPRGATVASEIPGIFQYYLEKYERPDIRPAIMSQPGFDLAASSPDFVVLQRGRTYFENRDSFRFIQRRFRAEYASIYQGAASAQVYATSLRAQRSAVRDRLPPGASPPRLPERRQ